MTAHDAGAMAALDLLERAALVTEDETSWQDHSEGIRAAIQEGGLALAIQRERDFESTLTADDFDVTEMYGEFPPTLMALLP